MSLSIKSCNLLTIKQTFGERRCEFIKLQQFSRVIILEPKLSGCISKERPVHVSAKGEKAVKSAN
jgi:hypothetical protein